MSTNRYIQPSSFNRRITVKRAATLIDDGGGTDNTAFIDRFETWASVDQMSTSRKAFYGLDLFQNAYEITLRYTSDRTFSTADLVDYEDLTLEVMSAQTVRQSYKQFTVLICRESNLS